MDTNSFETRPDGLYSTSESGSDGFKIAGPLVVKAQVRDGDSQNWAKLVEWKDADGVAHEWAMPMSAYLREGSEALNHLANGGLSILVAKGVIEYLKGATSEVRFRAMRRTGWHLEGKDYCYVRPDVTIGAAGAAVKFVGSSDEETFGTCGDLNEWKEEVAALCVGNSRLLFAVSLGFASMMLHFMEEENGGIHLVGPSSCGKTTAARVAASVFGGEKYVQRWRATDNGLEGVAEKSNDALLVVDELGQADPKTVGSVAYMLANGQGKVRASRSGEARARKAWRLLFLSTGETTLAQHMAESGHKVRAGQEVRFVDLRADAGKGMGVFEELHGSASPAEFAARLKDVALSNFGTASAAFAEILTENAFEGDVFQEMHRSYVAEVLQEAEGVEVGGQARRVAERFALVGMAGEYATDRGITGWELGAAMGAARRCFRDWLDARESVENSEPTTIVTAVQTFLEKYGESRFTVLGDTEDWHPDAKTDRPPYNRAGWKRKVGHDYHFLILPDALRNEICSGLDMVQACRVLAERKCLETREEAGKTRYSLHRHIPGTGKRRLYEVTAEIWNQ